MLIIASAIATNCPFILIIPSNTNLLATLAVGDLLSGLELPPGFFSILSCDKKDIPCFLNDLRIHLFSYPEFYPSSTIINGNKLSQLEYVNVFVTIVDEDQKHNLKSIAKLIVENGFYKTDHSCINLQRVFIQENIYGELASFIVHFAKKTENR
jgi:acyl-CoA reductase-like NAD-dependent aldehyde dehydrogenase